MPNAHEIADFLAREFPQTKCTVVAAGGYETGPGSNTAVGGVTEEIHHALGTGQLRRLEGRGAEAPVGREPGPSKEDIAERLERYAKADSPLGKSLTALIKADPSFDPAQFLDGAKTAYEMVVGAFAEGDGKTLKQLLGDDVLDGFSKAIAEREQRGETHQSTLVGIDKADIIEAELKDKQAYVTVKFVSELISVTRDAAGEIVDGDPKKVREVTDIWTFARDTSSRNPNWKLAATEAAN